MRVWSVVLAALVAAPAAAQHAPPPIAVRDTTLANGLQIYVIENHAVPLVSEGFLVRGGALAQDSGQAGVPNLYLHTPAIAERAFHRDLAQMRGSATVAAQQEFVARFIVIPAANANDGLSALSRVLHNPDFTYDGLKLARTTVFGELQTTQAHPEYALHRAVDARLWSTAWGRKDILGDPITTATATTATLDAFYRRYYIPNNAAIVVSGDVSAAAIFRAAQHAFGRWRPGPDPFAAHPVPPIPGLDS
ncbi:MAG TPA: insulinase family protein, partial [Gemmatimonadaceae bacterium]|nr:insulinase family protein [Gemmatimonadaceae bacterium]